MKLILDIPENYELETAEMFLKSFKNATLEQEPTEEEKALLKKWRDNRGISMKDFEDALDELQKPKSGHWIKLKVGYGCSECTLATNDYGKEVYRYCPNCGAKMESEEKSCLNCKYNNENPYQGKHCGDCDECMLWKSEV